MAFEMGEDNMGQAFDLAVSEIKKWEKFQEELRSKLGKEKKVIAKVELPQEVPTLFAESIVPILDKGLFGTDSKNTILEAEHKWKEIVAEKYADDDATRFVAEDYLHTYLDQALHKAALQKDTRPDMRGLDEVRNLSGVAGDISPVLHGSGIFYRGETHVMSILTLAGPESMHTIDGIEFTAKKRFMHHYNFPPYSAGETGRTGGINRREMGHGFLAEKALIPVIPEKEIFPYTIRVVSESTASNGSTSQASICAATIALMDGGVPIKKPVAGISVGVMMDESDSTKYKLITDIQGPEDHYGDMDFKVAGTNEGITAIQLDIKVGGIPVPILKEALVKAKNARAQILNAIINVIPAPRADISPNAPKILTIKIKKDQIGMVIGPGGKNVNAIREETGAEISIEEDGTVFVTGKDGAADKARAIIADMTHEYVAGEEAEGTVVKITDFGAFVRIGRDTEGLVHVSEMAPFRIEKVSDILKEGDKVPVKVLKLDEKGRLAFSIKEANKDFFKPKA
jgi:polyribonucleotide nucleotidyltransferase